MGGMMTNYSIDTGDGNQLCAGLQGYDYALKVAQERANDLAETVYLYAPSEVAAAEEAGEEHESEPVEPETVRCECGAWCGVRCQWIGPVAETVVVEYMPDHLRSSHEAAGNSGVYPHNGARRIRVERSCAAAMVRYDGEWCSIVEGAA